MSEPRDKDDFLAAGARDRRVYIGWWGRAAHLGGTGLGMVASLPAWPLLLGVVLGFGLCSLAGRIVSDRPMFEHFVRFHGAISPSNYFYPTASELASYVRNTVPRSKYLVVVGGASYFRGTGQNPDELWTLELQRLLGDDYAVVNFAMDQSGVTSFAGVAFQILAREYPRIAYVANASPVVVDPIDGGEVYRYVFWDAYYKGMIPLPAPWSERVRELAREERADPAGLELHLGKWIDQFTHACDLWTYVGYKYIFTVWSDGMPDTLTSARGEYIDGSDQDLAQRQRDLRRNLDYRQRYEEMNRDFATKGFVRNKSGNWELDPVAFDIISQLSETMFPDSVKSKCFLVLVRANPFFEQAFTADDWRRHETMFRQGQLAFEKAGYRVVQLPESDFTPDDFVDGGHYMVSGGRKVARAVSIAIKTPAPPDRSSGP
ncbi:MAG: hypothetical protein ABSH26_02555 [Opitutaceae bacterium]|jgi:hypothetical protein